MVSRKKKEVNSTRSIERSRRKKTLSTSSVEELRCQSGWEALSPKHQDFIMAYVSCGNPTEACRRNGYKGPHNAAVKMMKNPQVKQYLGWWKNKVYESQEIDTLELFSNLNQTIARSIKDYAEPESGMLETNVHNLSDEAAKQVDGMEQEVAELYGPDGEVVGRKIKTKLKLIPKTPAVKLAAEIAGLMDRDESKKAIMSIDWDAMVGKPPEADGEMDDIEKKLAAIEKKPGTRVKKKRKRIK